MAAEEELSDFEDLELPQPKKKDPMDPLPYSPGIKEDMPLEAKEKMDIALTALDKCDGKYHLINKLTGFEGAEELATHLEVIDAEPTWNLVTMRKMEYDEGPFPYAFLKAEGGEEATEDYASACSVFPQITSMTIGVTPECQESVFGFTSNPEDDQYLDHGHGVRLTKIGLFDCKRDEDRMLPSSSFSRKSTIRMVIVERTERKGSKEPAAAPGAGASPAPAAASAEGAEAAEPPELSASQKLQKRCAEGHFEIRIYIDDTENTLIEAEHRIVRLIETRGPIKQPCLFAKCFMVEVETYMRVPQVRVCNQILSIDVSGSHIGDDGLCRLTEALDSPFSLLTSLRLVANRVSDEGAESLAKLLAKELCRISFLDLSHNSIGNCGAGKLAAAVRQESCWVSELWLPDNLIGDPGAMVLAEALEQPACSITVLLLELNLLEDPGVFRLAEALEKDTCKVVRLNVGMNKNTKASTKRLAKAFATTLRLDVA